MENQEQKSKTKKVLGTIGNILLWMFVAFAIVVTILAFASLSNADGIPTVGGSVISPILSPSMSPTINQGDIIFSTKLSEADKQELQVGDIISFRVDLNGDGKPEVNTHRIVEVTKREDGVLTSVKTKGDNNAVSDNYTVSVADIISKYTEGKSLKIPGLGNFISFLLTSTGFLVVIVIPLLLFFIFEVIMFVRRLMQIKNAGKKQITAADEELIKQRAIEEYLKAQAQVQAQEQKTETAEATETTEPTEVTEPKQAEVAETEAEVEQTTEEKAE